MDGKHPVFIMVSQDILRILKTNSQFNKFIENIENYEILIKTLKPDEIKRLLMEYPNLLKIKKDKKENSDTASILCMTFVKRDVDSNNYLKLKKIRVYINEMNHKILKILEN